MRTFIITAFILLLSLQGVGQIKKIDRFYGGLYKGKLTNEDFFNKSEYIIEVKCFSCKMFLRNREIKKGYDPFDFDSTYYNNENEIIITHSLEPDVTELITTSCLGIVTYVYKGQGIQKNDTIELIKKSTFSNYSDKGNNCCDLDFPHKGIIFARKIDDEGMYSKRLTLTPFVNIKHTAIYYSDMPEKHNFRLYGLRDLYFKTKANFYEYASQFDGITVPKIKDSHDNYYAHKARFTDFMNKQYALVEKAKANKKRIGIKTNRNLTISIKNQKISNDNDKRYIEFDVYAQANSNDIYYSNAISRITFNPLIFGFDLASQGKITLTKGKAFDNEIYTTNTYDVSPNVLHISLNEAYNLSSQNRTKLSPTPQILFHVKIEILSVAKDGYLNIAFTQMDFTDDFSLYSLSANGNTENLIPYNNTIFINPPDFFSKNAHKNYSNPALDSFMKTQYLLREKAIKNQKRMKENER